MIEAIIWEDISRMRRRNDVRIKAELKDRRKATTYTSLDAMGVATQVAGFVSVTNGQP
jgi:hypothetical protein